MYRIFADRGIIIRHNGGAESDIVRIVAYVRGRGKVRVLVVERSPFLRLVLREVLARANYEMIGECDELGEAADLAGNLGPDVVLCDLDGSREEWPATIHALRHRAPSARLIALGSTGNCPVEGGDFEAFLRKPCTPEAVLAAISRRRLPDDVLPA